MPVIRNSKSQSSIQSTTNVRSCQCPHYTHLSERRCKSALKGLAGCKDCATITNHISNYGEPGSSVERATFEIYKDGVFKKSSNYSLSDFYVGYDDGLTEDAFKNWWWRGMMEAVIEALGKTAVNIAETDATPDTVLQMLTGRKAKKIPGANADDLFKYTKKANFTPIILGGAGLVAGPVHQVVKYAEGDNKDTAVATYMIIYDRQWVEHSATIWEIAESGLNDLYFLEDEGSVP